MGRLTRKREVVGSALAVSFGECGRMYRLWVVGWGKEGTGGRVRGRTE